MEFITKTEDLDYINYKKTVDSLCDEYRFINKTVIGRSCSGRDITALKVGKGHDYSLFAASFHGSEHITTNILLFFIEELCCAIKNDTSLAGLNVRKAMFGRGIIFVPCVNPDGCEISINKASGCGSLAKQIGRLCKNDFTHWNANLRGVDINHNFSAGWENLRKLERESGIYGPSPTRFGGFKAESEPETLALTELCRSNRIHHVVALHSQGEVIYWTYGDKKPNRSEKMAEIMATSSGYALDVPVGLAHGGGFKDWFIDEFDRPGFTVEVGKGENPLPIENSYDIYSGIKEMLMLSSIM